jgi:hypothetical protein
LSFVSKAPSPLRFAGAVHDQFGNLKAHGFRASVLECGGPPPLFPGAA